MPKQQIIAFLACWWSLPWVGKATKNIREWTDRNWMVYQARFGASYLDHVERSLQRQWDSLVSWSSGWALLIVALFQKHSRKSCWRWPGTYWASYSTQKVLSNAEWGRWTWGLGGKRNRSDASRIHRMESAPITVGEKKPRSPIHSFLQKLDMYYLKTNTDPITWHCLPLPLKIDKNWKWINWSDKNHKKLSANELNGRLFIDARNNILYKQ